MSGITGLWNLDGQPADERVLARMSATIRHRGLDGEGRGVSGPVGLAHQHLWVTPEEMGESQPVVHSGMRLVMDGRLDNRAELLGWLRLPVQTSDAATVLAAYREWGERFAEHLNGDFAIALFDESGQRLLLVRDPIGVRPLYYYHNQRMLLFASEIKALLAHPDVPVLPDDDGLADFLLLGSRPLDGQDRTCFAGIFALVPAHVVLVTPERVVTRRYWDFDTGAALRLRSFDEYAEGFRHHFAEAVRRRTRAAGPVAVSVSGGLDSSSIFCQAAALGRSNLAGISYTGSMGSDADEESYLREVERECQVAFHRIPMDSLLGLVSHADEQIRAVEAPFLDYMWGVSRAVRSAAQDRGARTIISGHWGDQVLFSPAYLVDLARRFAWRQARDHLREYDRWLGAGQTSVLRRRFFADLVRHYTPTSLVPPLKWIRRKLFPEQRLKTWFGPDFLRRGLRFANRPASIGNGFHSAQARALYVEARSKYHVHCMEWNNKVSSLAGLDAAFPFLDRDLLAFLMAVPGEIHNRGGVPRALLREAMKGILPEAVRGRVWKADFSVTVNEGLIRDFDAIARALSPKSAAVRRGYLVGDRVADEVQVLARGLSSKECFDSWDLADMFGLEVWLQVFFSATPEHQPRDVLKGSAP